jgi:alpha-beta hydrolase superfamily lysophospholipase
MTELIPEAVEAAPLEVHGRSFYLDLAPDPVFATLHPAAPSAGPRIGAILCPAFGWDELASHRSVRAFAGALAHAGFPALRFDLPGTGDSGGSPRGRALLEPWTAAVAAAAVALADEARCERIVAIGIGLGGMLACRAMALGAPIDDLVLWAVPSRGSTFVRELRAFARMFPEESGGESAGPAGASPVSSDDSLNVLGFVLPAETIAQLETLDLAAVPVAPPLAGKRVLQLGRDNAAVDPQLRSHFEGSGAEVTAAAGSGYGAMMVDPQFSRHPHEIFELTLAWLAEGPAAPTSDRAPSIASVATSASIEVAVGAAVVAETPFAFDHRGEQLAGILTVPVSPSGGADPELCAVLLNAGAVRRIGHSRQYVETARRWAARGVPTLRFDISGVGDSDGSEERYVPRDGFQRVELAEQVRAALDELERRGLPPRFIVGGVCSGAYWALQAALSDERVRGLLLLNLLAFYWSAELGAARDARRTRALLRTRDVKTIFRIVAADRWRIRRMLRTGGRRARALHVPRDGRTQFAEQVVGSLDQLRGDGVAVLLLLSLDEPLFDDFLAWGLTDRLGEWPNLHFERIETTDHVFRSLWAQRAVDRALDAALERTLGEVERQSRGG